MLGAEKWELQSDGATFFRKFAEAIFDDSFALGTTLFSGKIPSALCADSITKESLNAIFVKQNYETIQIKNIFYKPAAKADPDGIGAISDKAREPLVDAIAKSFVPITHTLKIEPQ